MLACWYERGDIVKYLLKVPELNVNLQITVSIVCSLHCAQFFCSATRGFDERVLEPVLL